MSSKGYFIVFRDTEHKDDIHFRQIELSGDESIPEEQLQLRDEVDKASTSIRMIFLNEPEKFEQYFRSLLALAQLGLVGDSANPNLAARALASLKHEILAREGGRIKNQYMKVLGKYALAFGVPVLILAVLVNIFFNEQTLLQSYLFLWVGCMAGVWLSFGSRKIELKFEELNVLEKDRLNPSIRLIFAGLLTIVVGLLISTESVVFELGGLSTSQFQTNIQVALLIGILCGISEQVLSTKISQHASDFIGAK